MGADVAEGFVGEEAEEEGGAVGFAQADHGVVECAGEAGPGGGVVGSGLGGCRSERGVGDGELFAGVAGGFAADEVDGLAAGHGVEPCGEWQVGADTRGGAGEFDEDGLSGFFGEVSGAGLAEGGGVNEVEVAGDELAEGVFVVLRGVAGEEGVVVVGSGLHRGVRGIIAAGWKSRQAGGEIFWKSVRGRLSLEIPFAGWRRVGSFRA